MNRRETVLATLNHEEVGLVPNQTVFMDINAEKKFIPTFSDNFKENALKRLDFLDNFIVEVGYTGLHESKWLGEADELERVISYRSTSGGGVLRTRVIEENKQYLLMEFETGARWRIEKDPFRRDYISHPIKTKEDLYTLDMPNVDNPERYKGVEDNIKFFKEKGYFTSAEVNGFFSGVWYRYMNLPDFMTSLILEKSFTKELVDKIGKFNFMSAKDFLERGVDSILFPDDLGTNTGMLISPALYKDYFYPWHKKLADLCHQYNAYCHMHSHGNINKILALIIKAGVDILDPVGPSDNISLKDVKSTYGDKITFFGGISKFIGQMTKDELTNHLREVINIGKVGGGFMTRSEGGVPIDMSEENFRFYLNISREYRGRD